MPQDKHSKQQAVKVRYQRKDRELYCTNWDGKMNFRNTYFRAENM